MFFLEPCLLCENKIHRLGSGGLAYDVRLQLRNSS